MTLGAVRFAGAIALLFLMYNFSRKKSAGKPEAEEKESDRKTLIELFFDIFREGFLIFMLAVVNSQPVQVIKKIILEQGRQVIVIPDYPFKPGVFFCIKHFPLAGF